MRRFPFAPLRLVQRGHAYIRLARSLLGEDNSAVNQSEEGVVFTHTNVLAWIVYGATLTNNDVACLSHLTAIEFYTESFALRLTAVFRTTYTFFVCHTSLTFLRLCNNLLNQHLRQILAVTVAFLITSSTLLLEHQNLVVFEVFKNLTLYRGAFYNRCTYLNLTAILHEQDLVENHRRINFARKTVNIEFSTLFSLELLTCNLYYYKHFMKF